MKYSELMYYMNLYHLGHISKIEMGMAIHMWQRANNYKVVDYEKGNN